MPLIHESQDLFSVSMGNQTAAEAAPDSKVPDFDWVLSATPPPDWELRLISAGGGFFHSPLGLRVGAPAGEPVYGTLRWGKAGIGIAVGVLSSCRFATTPRHAYFPSLPALSPSPWRDHALAALITELNRRGVAEVVMDSFDAPWMSGQFSSNEGRARVEHLVPLNAEPDKLLAGFGRTHRQRWRRGERAHWTMRSLSGQTAQESMSRVLKSAGVRAQERGRGFLPGVFTDLDQLTTNHSAGGGDLHVFAAENDGSLLAATVIGVGGDRGYYVAGGSTPEGYGCHAAIWLHYNIMIWLRERGCKTYNLGGTLAAANPGDPGHGLYHFKAEFGGEVRACRNVRHVLRPVHVALHHFLGSASRLVRR